jgi:hypothetical protein
VDNVNSDLRHKIILFISVVESYGVQRVDVGVQWGCSNKTLNKEIYHFSQKLDEGQTDGHDDTISMESFTK